MPIPVEPNIDQPLPSTFKAESMDKLSDQLRVMGNTSILLQELGADDDMTEEDMAQASEMMKKLKLDGGDQTKDSKTKDKATREEAKKPGVALAIGHLVSYYDQQVIQDKVQLRNIAVNKFMELINSDDEKIQIKAAEMLGKAGDLFVEHSEVTITHKSSDELKDAIRERIAFMMQRQAEIDVTPTAQKLANTLEGNVTDVTPKNDAK